LKRELNRRRFLGSQAGFTLIELMIVIAIIGILAAVAIPNFLRARDRAQYTRCVESLTAIKMAQEMYITDWGFYAPTDGWDFLAQHMIAGCIEADGSDCTGKVKARIENNCDTPTLTIVGAGGAFDYQVKGVAKDRFQCQICVSPSGYFPERYDPTDCVAGTCP
jgi:prepilin-type N-terminal cleavage/methylation domain-containing protein